MAPSTRIVMLGTGDFALPTFEHLCATGHQVVELITQPDRPQGRKQELIPSRIKLATQSRENPGLSTGRRQRRRFHRRDPRGRGRCCLSRRPMAESSRPNFWLVPPLWRNQSARVGLAHLNRKAAVARAIERGEVESGVTVILMSPRIDARGHDQGGHNRPSIATRPAGELGRQARRRLGWLPLGGRGDRRSCRRPCDDPCDKRSFPSDEGPQASARMMASSTGQSRRHSDSQTWSQLAMQPWPSGLHLSWPVHDGRKPGPLRVIVHKGTSRFLKIFL